MTTPVLRYMGQDEVSGKYNYINNNTLSALQTDTPPTSAQEAAYYASNPLLRPGTIPTSAISTLAQKPGLEGVEMAANTAKHRYGLSSEKQAIVNASGNLFAGDDPAKYAANLKPKIEPAAETQKANKTSTTTDTAAMFKDNKNKLFDYATYTYGLTLFMLHKEEFEELQTMDVNKLGPWNPKYALISSAGRYSKPYSANTPNVSGRQAEFHDDFYFENFRMTTVVGLNSQSRGTNAIDISFTIIEPYGLTLLDRMIAASNGPEINSQNYLVQPYLLELDFFGSTDVGTATGHIPKLRKRFPISIIEFKIKAGIKGSEYTIKAVPYTHRAFQESVVSIPVNLEVNANTIDSFFAVSPTGDSSLTTAVDQRAEHNQTVLSNAKTQSALQHQGSSRTVEVGSIMSSTAPYKVNSFADALNDWHDYNLQKSNTAQKDTVQFRFDPLFSGSKIVPPEAPKSNSSLNPTDAASNTVGNNPDQNAKTPGNINDVHKLTINAGTSIVEVINMVMRNSEYITSQLVDVNGKKDFAPNTTVKFYKIVPQIIKLTYDTERKRYAYDTVYHVVPYEYVNAKHPNLPFAYPSYAVKEYNYLYTGKNLDILDFQIDFNVAYFNGVVALPSSVNAGNTLIEQSKQKDPDNVEDPQVVKNDSKAINQYPMEIIPQTAQTGGGVTTASQSFVANALTSIYSNARGDMISVKIKIVGDPDFIKQDDLYTNPGMKNYEALPVDKNGTISMDYTDIFCRVNFRTPTDMDEATGLMRMNGKYIESKFSGFYKILTVDNEFSKGQFAQTLTCVRMPDAPKAAEDKTQGSREAIRAVDAQIAESDSRAADGIAIENKSLLDRYPAPIAIPSGRAVKDDIVAVTTPPALSDADSEVTTAKNEAADLKAKLAASTQA